MERQAGYDKRWGAKKEPRELVGIRPTAAIVIVVTMAIRFITGSISGNVDAGWSTAMFFDAFTEELLFRGAFFPYLMTLIDWRVAAGTSIAAHVPAHPQCIGSLFIVAAIAQAIVLTGVACRTRNIIGPWVSYGLSRIIPQMIWAGT